MKEVIELNQYLSMRRTQCLQEAEALMQDERADDARFKKAKGNIYEVYQALLKASESLSKGDCASFQKIFLQKADAVSSNWRKSLEVAVQHQDYEKQLIEEAKLSAVEDIMQAFSEMIKAGEE